MPKECPRKTFTKEVKPVVEKTQSRPAKDGQTIRSRERILSQRKGKGDE